MSKSICALRHETVEVKETERNARAIIPVLKAAKHFRDDGRCPECFAEMVYREGITSCDLCGYTECD